MPTSINLSGITFPNGTTQTTAFTGSGGVTSLNGATGAIVNNTLQSIGSYTSGAAVAGGNITVGSTYAGSSIQRMDYSTGDYFGLGYSGTWRVMGGEGVFGVNSTVVSGSGVLFIRIS